MEEEIKPVIKPITRNVVVMGFVSLFNDISSEMIYPIVPIFLKSVLGAPATVIGLIEGIAESTASIMKIFSGWFSDKIQKRKIFVTIGYSLSGISKVLIGLANTWPFVLFARFIDRFGKGTRTAARDSLILESVAPEHRGKAFGFHRSMDGLGAVFGPLLALWLIVIFKDNYRSIFFWAAVPSLIGVLLLIAFVKEKKKTEVLGETKPIFKFKWSELDGTFKFFVFINIIFAIGNSSDAFLILRAQSLGLGVTLTVASYVLYNLTRSATSYPAGIISDKIGPRKILFVGFALFAIVYFLFGFISNSLWVWFLFPLYGVYMGLTDGISKAYIAQTLSSPEKSGTAYGIYYAAIGICALSASLIAGFLWKYVSVSAPFYFGAVMAALAAILFIVFSKTVPKISQVN